MNLYIRYFNDECVVTTFDEAMDFIRGIEGFKVTPDFEADFREYVESSQPYPKKYKVRPRVYFIIIKTTATTLEEFKANGRSADPDAMNPVTRSRQVFKEQIVQRLNDEMPGWYEGTVHFKRVVYIPETGKYDYCDTTFTALTKAHSAQDCYNRIIDHLRMRSDVDPRSQFPSVKGRNFQYTYIGFKPLSELNV